MRWLLHTLLCLCAVPSAAMAVELAPVKINGLDKKLEAHVRSAIALPEDAGKTLQISDGRLSYYMGTLNTLVEDSLEPMGFYDVRVDSRLERTGDAAQIIIDVALGDPVRVRDSELRVDGPAGNDRIIGYWLEGFTPAVGDVFEHASYEASKADITQALLDRGYFEQNLAVHEVRVTRASQSADINLVWDSGPRYRYGGIRFEGNSFEPGLLEQLVGFEEGQYYTQTQINRLQESLSKLGYFSAIQIVPDLDQKSEDSVPIVVTVTPAQQNSQYASLRYGTETGFGVQYGIERRWINARGHKINLDLSYAQYERSVTALYRIPAFGWLDGWYGFGFTAREEDFFNAPFNYFEVFGNRSGEYRGWDLSAALKLRRERFDGAIPDFDPGASVAVYTSTLYPELKGFWRSSTDNYPAQGSAWRLMARAGYEFETANAFFVQGYAMNRRIYSFGSNNRILLRGELGALATQDYEYFPTSLRFYAGGADSIRGYAFREIGEYDGNSNLGGKYLATASVEYERKILPAWAIAGFVDAGDAFDSDPTLYVGSGIGARWRSPIGPVRLDVAYGFDGPNPGYAVYFSLGSDL